MAANKYDVIIIGAGPAGASAARTLVAGGMKALIIEKKKLPRQKICSGILGPWAVDFVNHKFGEIPESVYCQPSFLKGVISHYPSLPQPVIVSAKSPIPNIWRAHFDNFIVQGSGADIKDGLMLDRIEEKSGYFKILCKRFKEDGAESSKSFNAHYVVGADGYNSRSVKQVIPEAYKGIPWSSCLQLHYRGEIDIDSEYFHMFFHQEIGFYAWANIKDDHIHVGVGILGNRKINRYFNNFVTLLEKNYGLKIKKTLLREGMAAKLMAPFNIFALGKGNFLAVGDAGGFVHNGGEGISCALTTGDLAGEAILSAEKTNQKALDVYQQIVREEVDLCLDQFNLLRMFKTLPIPVDLKSVWRNYSLKQLYLMVKDQRTFFKKTGLADLESNKIARKNMVYRLIHRHYPSMRSIGDKFVVGKGSS